MSYSEKSFRSPGTGGGGGEGRRGEGGYGMHPAPNGCHSSVGRGSTTQLHGHGFISRSSLDVFWFPLQLY